MGDKEQKLLDNINAKFKAATLGVTIEARGNKLSVRGRFPAKPGETFEGTKQQRISLDCYFNPGGLRAAEAEAKGIAGQLAIGKFDWTPYIKKGTPTESKLGFKTLGECIDLCKQQFCARGGKLTSWYYSHELPFRALYTHKEIIDLSLSEITQLKTQRL